ncbi:MAG: HEAT repeat domain-containing protein, partial [Pontiellaceae bacterium]|nr:HEAT repeat domain-containing protein [Pontiellaceae bacterium]
SGYIALKTTPHKQPCTIDRKTLEIIPAQGTVYSTTEKRRFEITLHNGAQLLGKKHADSPRYQHSNDDKPFRTTTQREIDSGGLFYIPPNEEPKRISSRAAANAIPSDIVFSVAPALEKDRFWLCGDSGISLLDSQGHVLENIQRADGLPASRVTSAVAIDGNTYFALDSNSNYGDRMILNKDSYVFTSLSKADELTPPLSMLNEKNAELRSRHNSDFPSGAHEPLFGGFVVSTTKYGNTTMICGTRGLLIVSDSALPLTLKTKELAVNVQMDEAKNLAAEAQALKIERRISLERFKELLNHENPFVIAEAFGSAAFSEAVLQSPDFPVLAEKYLSNSEPRVRSTAFYALTQCSQNDAVIPILNNALHHSDNYIRAVTTINLCKRAILPPIENVREVFDEDDLYGDYPFGAISTIGTEASRQQMIEAVVPLATPEIFSMLMEHPPSIGDYWNETKVYPPLSKALLRQPEAADILLSAYDTDPYSQPQRNFAMNLFKLAGTNMLTTLHAALQSENEVVRSNAARACGAIGDSSSIEPLLAAWEINSKLTRTSIIWALGELNATKAVPLLEQAYTDIRVAEERSRGAFDIETSQRTAPIIRGNNLTLIAYTPPPQLVQAGDLLQALNKIDPSATQNFYRTLAADEDWSARNTAARQLAYAPDKTENIAILRLLLADSQSIQMSAASSLLILGDRSAEPYFLKWLSDEKQSTRMSALQQLTRVESPEALAFAQDAIEKSVSSTDSYEIDLATDLLKRLETEYPSHMPL